MAAPDKADAPTSKKVPKKLPNRVQYLLDELKLEF